MNINTMTDFKVSKYLDIREARSFANTIKPELRQEQPCVIVDMSNVEQIDIEGLDLLLRCILQIAKQDGSVQLAGMSPQAATVLELTRMDRIFAMFPETENQFYVELPQTVCEQEPVRQHSAA
jgi:anti-anti-sigma factor